MNDNTQKKNKELEHQPLTMEHAQALLKAARGSGLETLLLLALMTGMRRGELLGLKWADIDLAQGKIQVQRMLDYRSLDEFVETAPKTERDRRQIELPSFVIEMLQQRQDQQQEQRLRVAIARQERDYIFPGSQGNPLSTHDLLQQFTRIREAAGLPALRFHDLRYSARWLIFQ